MADVFISYAREDRDRVQRIASALESGSYSVWWDPEIQPGTQYDDVIDREINAANAVVVVWSENSCTSRWVKEEANDGLERGALVATRIDDIPLPRGFKLVQTADLTDWDGEKEHGEWQMVQARLIQLCGAPSRREKTENDDEAEDEDDGADIVTEHIKIAAHAGEYDPNIPRLRGFAGVFSGLKSIITAPIMTLVTTAVYIGPLLLGLGVSSYFQLVGSSESAKLAATIAYWVFTILLLPGPYILTAAFAIRRKWVAKTGTQISLGDLLGELNYRLWRIFKTALWVSILNILTFLLLIIPGIWFAVRYGFSASVAAAEGKSVSGSMKRSRQITKRRFWSVLKFYVIAGFTTTFVMMLIYIPTLIAVVAAAGDDYEAALAGMAFIAIPITFWAYYTAIGAILAEGYIRLANEKAKPAPQRTQELIRQNISLNTLFADNPLPANRRAPAE